ncbi:BLUF domain-containing protein [Fibrella forsythiae]|uniref:BLUF domain-containing protein n=1 Tax=Fibrella forsythiae TaxID=2817061 RepID=A0ABS3JNI1_9BACT|nr:BLUF domain-containing protein [Fibrella forsythiae]MBO0951563.1 BLUF domain-containing protein [Fibrella forsythiae]
MESCIVYFSRAIEPFEIGPLLAQSQRNNTRWGITGVTLYVRGSVVQVLEGEDQVLRALYQRIEADPRHHQVEHILTRPITQRLFSTWSMGYETISDSQLEEIHTAGALSEDESTFGEEPLVLRIIRTFYEANRHNQMPSLSY